VWGLLFAPSVGAPGRRMRVEDQLPPAISMVIRTEYRGQRYSIGSSNPLPAGFEIRFGSLNFQATGNDYLIRVTNRDELHPRRTTGLGPVPVAPAADAPAPAAGPSAPQRRRRSGQHSRQARTERRLAVRVVDGSKPCSSSPQAYELRIMCGSRTGGWSLPCVMIDWQRCVD
jgi:hypothetical protein